MQMSTEQEPEAEYDPDMDVMTAIRLGLVVPVEGTHQPYVVESPKAGRNYVCDEFHPSSGTGMITLKCARTRRHKGPHVFVMRWLESPDEKRARDKRERAMKELEAMRTKEVKRLRDELEASIQKMAEKVSANSDALKVMEKAIQAANSRVDSRVQPFGKARFKDSTVGKVRGR